MPLYLLESYASNSWPIFLAFAEWLCANVVHEHGIGTDAEPYNSRKNVQCGSSFSDFVCHQFQYSYSVTYFRQKGKFRRRILADMSIKLFFCHHLSNHTPKSGVLICAALARLGELILMSRPKMYSGPHCDHVTCPIYLVSLVFNAKPPIFETSITKSRTPKHYFISGLISHTYISEKGNAEPLFGARSHWVHNITWLLLRSSTTATSFLPSKEYGTIKSQQQGESSFDKILLPDTPFTTW